MVLATAVTRDIFVSYARRDNHDDSNLKSVTRLREAYRVSLASVVDTPGGALSWEAAELAILTREHS